MKYTELKEIIKNWDTEQTRATHVLLKKGEALEDIIDLIDNQEFMFYPYLEDYIMQAIEKRAQENDGEISKDDAVRHEILARLFEQSYEEIADAMNKFP